MQQHYLQKILEGVWDSNFKQSEQVEFAKFLSSASTMVVLHGSVNSWNQWINDQPLYQSLFRPLIHLHKSFEYGTVIVYKKCAVSEVTIKIVCTCFLVVTLHTFSSCAGAWKFPMTFHQCLLKQRLIQTLNLGSTKKWPGSEMQRLSELPNPCPHHGW